MNSIAKCYFTLEKKILSTTAHEGPFTSQLLASHPYMSSDTAMDDHAASIEVICGQHVVSSSHYSWPSQLGFATY